MKGSVKQSFLVIVVTILPFVFIGSAYFLIPRFIEIYADILSSRPLPSLTEKIIEVPHWIWLAVSTLLATLNVLNISRFKRNSLSVVSTAITMLIPMVVIAALFLPLQVTIESISHEETPASEQNDADNQ